MEIPTGPSKKNAQLLHLNNGKPAELRSVGWKLSSAIVGILVLVQLFELPKIADWSLFAFFDPGTTF